ncbi:MAG: outer membrane protein transport protein [Bacteroidetes bacterium]|nr:outer membrane protein transport protein [Bacteroidota bacterium]
MKKVLFSCLILFPLLVKAGGYQINTQSQKGASMGGSVTGLAMDASVTFYNPAGLSALDSNYFNIGASLLMPKTAFLGPYGGTEQLSTKSFSAFYLYGNYILNSKLTLGLSVNTPFGLGTKWDNKWSGRYVIQEARITTLFIQPTLAYKLNDRFSVGVGPVIVTANTKFRKALNVLNQDGTDGQLELKGAGNGFGFNAGVFARLGKTSVGISYRSEVKLDIENGDAVFSNIPVSLISNGTYPTNAKYNSSITLPSVISVGVGRVLNEKLTANLDVNFTSWNVNDSLVFSYADYPALNTSSARKFKNSFAIRIGAKYQYSERMQLRGGIGYDQSPVPDGYVNPELPDADKVILGAGCTYKLKKGWSLEGSFTFEDLRERKKERNKQENINGTYKSYIYVLGLGLQYQF